MNNDPTKLNPLEISCYAVGTGAFGVFTRWMQLMLAYNDDGVVDKSFWNIAIIALFVICYFAFSKTARKAEKKLWYLPEDFCFAFANDNKIYKACRWAFGSITSIGGLILLMQCEVDKNAIWLMILAVLAVLTGFAFPLLLSSANRPKVYNRVYSALLATVPIVFIAFWLLTCYKQNSINPVLWDFAVQIGGLILILIAYYKIAGYTYGKTNEYSTLVSVMLGATAAFTNLADSRYIGEQIIFAGIGLMLTNCVWIMVANLKKGKPLPKKEALFERIK